MLSWVNYMMERLSKVTLTSSETKQVNVLVSNWIIGHEEKSKNKDIPGELKLALELVHKRNEELLITYLASLETTKGYEDGKQPENGEILDKNV